MRFGLVLPLLLAFADATPHGEAIDETRWKDGDFVAVANQPLHRLFDAGDTVGLQISGRGESCLLRRRSYPLKLPCLLTFRVRVSNERFSNAFPSLHVVFEPPDPADPWWKEPTVNGGRYWKGRMTFLFHFSTTGNWRQMGMTEELESAPVTHAFSPRRDRWIDLSIRLESDAITVYERTATLGTVKANLSMFSGFTYGIGDQTSTFVELAAFRCASDP